MEDEHIEFRIQSLGEEIEEWREQGVYSGDQGFQDMLSERDALLEEQEQRQNGKLF